MTTKTLTKLLNYCIDGNIKKFTKKCSSNIIENNTNTFNEYFIIAAKHGNFELAMFLANNCKVNIHAQQDLAFQYAVCYGHFEIVKFLVENGANIHTCNNYAFKYADIYKHYDILEYLNDCVKPTQIPYNATCNECCICLDTFESYADKPKNWKILKCHHKICIHCYHKLINNTSYTNCHNCPLCRATF